MAGEADDNNDVPDAQASVNIPPIVSSPTIDKRWLSQDLQILRSGLFADAEIVCQDGSVSRKVHQTILAGRSVWFKKAFFGGFTEAKECKVNLQETPWRVDLMLYFFYTGGIDLEDETLISGHDVMDISVELLRLGDFFKSTEMCLYGKKMLSEYLCGFLIRICGYFSSSAANEASFTAETNFPQRFCGAIVNAFDKDRPVKPAQDILADFAFAARIHLFKNTEFVSFIKNQVVPEFGNLVLAAQITGSVSDVFKDNGAFERWKDWRVIPPASASPQPKGTSLFGTAPKPATTTGLFSSASPGSTLFGGGSGSGGGVSRGGFTFGGATPK